jgi:hypothetical protein
LLSAKDLINGIRWVFFDLQKKKKSKRKFKSKLNKKRLLSAKYLQHGKQTSSKTKSLKKLEKKKYKVFWINSPKWKKRYLTPVNI